MAADRGHVAVVKELTNRGARHSWDVYRILFWVANGGNYEVAKLPLESADVNGTHSTEMDQPLPVAARNDDLELGKLLLETGADANTRMGSGDLRLLMRATSTGDSHAVKVLVELGVVAKAKTSKGWTSSKRAHENSHIKIAECLKAHGAKE